MIVAIVLAAGRSERMGVQKLLLPFGATCVIAHIVDEVLASPVDEVLVVVGRDRAAIEQALGGRRVTFVVNPEEGSDMLSSVRYGLRALPEEAQAVLVVLGDQPGISRDVVAELMRALGRHGGGIAVPTFRGKRGHPLLLSAAYCNEVLESFDQVGLCGLLQAHTGDVVDVPVSVAEVLEDVDVPADYRRICRGQ